MTPDQLTELTRLHEAASPPPWGEFSNSRDDKLICAMRNALPELLRCAAENRDLREKVEALSQESLIARTLADHQAAIVGPLERLLEKDFASSVSIAYLMHGWMLKIGSGSWSKPYPDLASALAAAEKKSH